jgi:hypothetical protein
MRLRVNGQRHLAEHELHLTRVDVSRTNLRHRAIDECAAKWTLKVGKFNNHNGRIGPTQ